MILRVYQVIGRLTVATSDGEDGEVKEGRVLLRPLAGLEIRNEGVLLHDLKV